MTQPKTTTTPPEMATLPSEEVLGENNLAPAQEERSRETRPLPAVDLPTTADAADAADITEAAATPPQETPQRAPTSNAAAPAAQHASDAIALPDADSDATVMRPAMRPPAPPAARPELDATTIRPAIEPRPRKNTLASAFTPPATRARADATPTPPPTPQLPVGVPDEIDDEVDEWAVADQPTVYLAPRPLPQSQPRPAYLETGENQAWPARPTPPPPTKPRAPEPQRPPSLQQQFDAPAIPERRQTQRPADGNRPTVANRPANPLVGQPRLATPAGHPMPGTPPLGVPRSALPDPRMARFQTLRQQRLAHDGGERAPNEPPSVATSVRQWWNDLMPNLQTALTYQREARASGIHPIPAYEPTPTSRLGDAFGRLAATARDITERAQAAASPTLKRLHNQAEQAAQAIVERIEGPTARQQAPLLGPGRVAIFFRQGVTVGQAQALLGASHARPIRLIPRKHGFLTLVTPGMEAEIGERLREHPYVRDVAYLEYDEYGQTVDPR